MGNPKNTADRLSWSYFKDIIEREKKPANEALSKTPVERSDHSIPNPRDLVSRERACRKAVDMAARYWAAKRKHALISPEVADYLLLRFNSAAGFLEHIDTLRPDFIGNEKRVLRWLLVDNWRTWGRADWMQYNLGDEWIETVLKKA